MLRNLVVAVHVEHNFKEPRASVDEIRPTLVLAVPEPSVDHLVQQAIKLAVGGDMAP